MKQLLILSIFGLERYLREILNEVELLFWIIAVIVFLGVCAFSLHEIVAKDWKTVLGRILVFMLTLILIIGVYSFISSQSF